MNEYVSEGSVSERPSMRCMICGLTAYARDPEMVKYGKSHYDCECGGHSFYPNAVVIRHVPEAGADGGKP